MKRLLFMFSLIFIAALSKSAFATEAPNVIRLNEILSIAAPIAPEALIEWKVGDKQEFEVSGVMGMTGTMTKVASKEEGNGIWISQQLTLPIMSDKTELLIDRDSGKTLKMIHNGKEEKAPEGEIEIIKTENTFIEVPAGKFKVMHITAKSKDVKQIDVWANPKLIALDGGAKMVIDQGQMTITLVLKSFVKQ